jgi:hypothetical protein
MSQLHPRRCRSSHLHNSPFYGLTEDGDFAMLGINAYESGDDDNSSTGQSVGELSSILAGTIFSGLNEEAPKQSFEPTVSNAAISRNNVPNNLGYTSSLSDAIFGRLDSSIIGMTDAKRGSVIGDNVGERSGNTQQQNQYTRSGSSVDETALSEIKEWLLSIIPALNQQDAESYSRGLDAIGFNPGCVTMCELQFEDLAFMKVLHRRYLFNEITGIEHPWEV